MSKYPANKIFPAKIKKAIFYCYVQNVSVNNYQIMDIAGKPFSQINMLDLWRKCLFQMILYVDNNSDILTENDSDFYELADIEELCNFILENEFIFRERTYSRQDGGKQNKNTREVINFIPKYLEIMDILRSGEVYKGLKMN